MVQEWSIVVEAPGLCACLVAWEVPLPHHVRDERRCFEALWSADPATVALSLELAVKLIATPAPDLAAQLRGSVEDSPRASSTEVAAAESVARRMIAYLTADETPRSRSVNLRERRR